MPGYISMLHCTKSQNITKFSHTPVVLTPHCMSHLSRDKEVLCPPTRSFCMSSWHTDSCSLELLMCSLVGMQVLLSKVVTRHLCTLQPSWHGWEKDWSGWQRWVWFVLAGWCWNITVKLGLPNIKWTRLSCLGVNSQQKFGKYPMNRPLSRHFYQFLNMLEAILQLVWHCRHWVGAPSPGKARPVFIWI